MNQETIKTAIANMGAQVEEVGRVLSIIKAGAFEANGLTSLEKKGVESYVADAYKAIEFHDKYHEELLSYLCEANKQNYRCVAAQRVCWVC